MDVVKEGMGRVGVNEEDAEESVRWRWMVHFGNLERGQPKGEEEEEDEEKGLTQLYGT